MMTVFFGRTFSVVRNIERPEKNTRVFPTGFSSGAFPCNWL